MIAAVYSSGTWPIAVFEKTGNLTAVRENVFDLRDLERLFRSLRITEVVVQSPYFAKLHSADSPDNGIGKAFGEGVRLGRVGGVAAGLRIGYREVHAREWQDPLGAEAVRSASGAIELAQILYPSFAGSIQTKAHAWAVLLGHHATHAGAKAQAA